MDIAMVGLGKMGLNMATRLLKGSHRVVAFDLSEQSLQDAEKDGAERVEMLEGLTSTLALPRAVWVMVAAGDPTEKTIMALAEILSEGDIVIDGGNSNYKDSVRRAAFCKEKGLHFVDVGTSGGIWGLKEGYSMMIGGEGDIVEHLRPVFETLAPAPEKGWGHVGPSGAGHFVKMVHNGIEYGLMQAYAEGFDRERTRKTRLVGEVRGAIKKEYIIRLRLMNLRFPYREAPPCGRGDSHYECQKGIRHRPL